MSGLFPFFLNNPVLLEVGESLLEEGERSLEAESSLGVDLSLEVLRLYSSPDNFFCTLDSRLGLFLVNVVTGERLLLRLVLLFWLGESCAEV